MSARPAASKHSSWVYTEQLAEGADPFAEVRHRAAEMGVEVVSPAVAATLTVLSSAVRAEAVVDVGTGVGLSAAALLRGASPQAVLTGIDPAPDSAEEARRTLRHYAPTGTRHRLIAQQAEQVLPRLAAGSYDLVFCDAGAQTADQCTEDAIRLLRGGGLLILHDALDQDRVPRPAVREETTQRMRGVHTRLVEDPRLHSTLLATGAGLFVSVRRAA
ncbi:O-methyltransferase [Nesterenkonia alba]|uniref:O-methyltransferase n=1 Tax=Nesterenkonia alba TaxID=515814 RepID=UPI0003B77BCF|nr:class I SAM-dependent methyltransferase [Nesterenkonia alba]